MTKPTYYSYYLTTIKYKKMNISMLIHCLSSKIFNVNVTTLTTDINHLVVR